MIRPTSKKTARSITFNMTPMIDITFQLIIFFMLVSTFTSAENIEMKLPAPAHSKAKEVTWQDRVVINCRLDSVEGDDGDAVYSIGPVAVADLRELGRRLAAAKQEMPDAKVILRADRRMKYREVRDVMKLIAANEIQMLNIAALTDRQE